MKFETRVYIQHLHTCCDCPACIEGAIKGEYWCRKLQEKLTRPDIFRAIDHRCPLKSDCKVAEE